MHDVRCTFKKKSKTGQTKHARLRTKICSVEVVQRKVIHRRRRRLQMRSGETTNRTIMDAQHVWVTYKDVVRHIRRRSRTLKIPGWEQ